MKYALNPKLQTLRADWQGNPILGNEFQYPDRPFRPSFYDILRWQFSPNPQRAEKKADAWQVPVNRDDHYLQSKNNYLVWLGHASFMLQLEGLRLLTDPVLYSLPFIKRFASVPFDLKQLTDIDLLLLSHDHRDHCDQKSFQTIFSQNNPQVLTSLRMTKVIGNWIPNANIQEAAWYQVFDIPQRELRITYLPSRHWCRRALTDFNRVLWGSFMIETSDRVIYFGADSAKGDHFAEIGRLFPKIDLAIIGIGAYKPGYVMNDVHTNPEEALEAFQQLGAARMIPMHYGTYDLSDEPLSEPYFLIQSCFAKAGLAERLLLPAVGEAVFL